MINSTSLKLSYLILLSMTFKLTQGQGIKFQQNLHWPEILSKAKVEKKNIFVDCYTSWCGPCKYMSKEVFTKETVGVFFNENYINVKMQLDSAVEDISEIKFQYKDASLINKNYKILLYPTYLFFNTNGELIHQDGGSCNENEFIYKGRIALDTNSQYYTQLYDYVLGNRDTSFLKNLTLLSMGTFDDSVIAKFAKEYIRLKSNILNIKDDLQFIFKTVRNTNDTTFILMINNIDKFESTIEKKQLKTTLISIITQSEFSTNFPDLLNWNKLKWNNYSNYISKKYLTFGEEAIFEIKTNAFINSSNWKDYVNTIEKYRIVHELSNEQLNDYAWSIFKYCMQPILLKKALIWSKITFINQAKIEPGYIDTYANLLYKLGRLNQAIRWEKEAQKIAVCRGESIDWGQDVMDKMVKGENTW